ncbi:acylglycerol kinase family protein [Novosphingobium sp. G106]|nr:acylglycerol kinase family protein [Novosphingobium sp. G106]
MPAAPAAALGESLRETVEQAFAAAGQEIELELVDGAGMAEAVARHRGKPRVVVGGGDGTPGCAATVLANTPTALAILPLGTRNHLGAPARDPARTRRCGGSGGRRPAPAHRSRRGGRAGVRQQCLVRHLHAVRAPGDQQNGPRWLNSILATWHVLRHMRAQQFTLDLDGEPRTVATPLPSSATTSIRSIQGASASARRWTMASSRSSPWPRRDRTSWSLSPCAHWSAWPGPSATSQSAQARPKS